MRVVCISDTHGINEPKDLPGRGVEMSSIVGYIAVFIAGIVLDEIFGSRLLAKINSMLAETESNIVAGVKSELAKLTTKL